MNSTADTPAERLSKLLARALEVNKILLDSTAAASALHSHWIEISRERKLSPDEIASSWDAMQTNMNECGVAQTELDALMSELRRVIAEARRGSV